MEADDLLNTGGLPSNALTAALLYKVLGPTSEYMGVKLRDYAKKCVENIERIVLTAEKLLESENNNGQVPPRIIKHLITDGAFVEDKVASNYLAGVLASSKTEDDTDDRGVVINSLISRLSSYQIRMHFVFYSALHELYQGTGSHGWQHLTDNKIVTVSTIAMLFSLKLMRDENEHEDSFDNRLSSVLDHCLFNLDKERLIGKWSFDWKKGFELAPTPLGVELFLWANGKGNYPMDYFYNRNFTNVSANEDVTVLVGEYHFPESDEDPSPDESKVLHGFNYSSPSSSLRCAIK